LCGRLKTIQASVKIVQKNSKNSIYIDLKKTRDFSQQFPGFLRKI
jgi:hypothetical protein